jgi:hypothetical protein
MTTATETSNVEKSELWFEKFKPIENTSQHAFWEYNGKNYAFETYGTDIIEVQKVARTTPNLVWTLVEGDDGMYITPGYHLVNRMAYFITQVPFTDDDIRNADFCDRIYEDEDLDD